jgi:dTDP-4-dehydrorhamnose reductase
MVLGAGGMLGHDLVATAPADAVLTPLTRAQLDITDREALEERIRNTRPDVIINAAAYTAVDRAETESELAFRVNGEAVGNLGRCAAALGVAVVHFSTDYVFDGTEETPCHEEAPTNPVNKYGGSKLAGERALIEVAGAHLIIRTQWLFGYHGSCFPRTMWERAQAKMPTRVVSDQIGRPTYTVHLADAVWSLTRRSAMGVFHVASSGRASWFEVASRVFAAAGVSELVSPCSSQEFPTPARRPRFSVLATEKFQSLTGMQLPDWTLALDQFLDAAGDPARRQ